MYILSSIGAEISESDIVNFEKMIELQLPKAYRDFLLKNNICEVSPNGFIYQDNETELDSVVNLFYGLKAKRSEYYYSLEWVYDAKKDRMPKAFIPIAGDPFGNEIILNVNDGSIWFWDHEEEVEFEEDEEPIFENIYLISKSLDDFLNSLYEVDLDEDE